MPPQTEPGTVCGSRYQIPVARSKTSIELGTETSAAPPPGRTPNFTSSIQTASALNKQIFRIWMFPVSNIFSRSFKKDLEKTPKEHFSCYSSKDISVTFFFHNKNKDKKIANNLFLSFYVFLPLYFLTLCDMMEIQ